MQCRTLQGHAHWVNTLALSTDYVLRTGAFEPATATVNPQDLTGPCKDLVTYIVMEHVFFVGTFASYLTYLHNLLCNGHFVSPQWKN